MTNHLSQLEIWIIQALLQAPFPLQQAYTLVLPLCASPGQSQVLIVAGAQILSYLRDRLPTLLQILLQNDL